MKRRRHAGEGMDEDLDKKFEAGLDPAFFFLR
jgi:hypothetical protein